MHLFNWALNFIDENVKTIEGVSKLLSILAVISTFLLVISRYIEKVWDKRREFRVAKILGRQNVTIEEFQNARAYFIQPDCQTPDPSDLPEPVADKENSGPLFEHLDGIISGNKRERFILLLADSGMGKTTALLNYYQKLTEKPIHGLRVEFISLALSGSLKHLAAAVDQTKTVLLLDAFDEDPEAIIDMPARMLAILQACANYYKVIITCRTQFFMAESEIPRETDLVKTGPRRAGETRKHLFHRVFISPFDSDKIGKYINRRFHLWSLEKRHRAAEIVNNTPHLMVRPMLLSHLADIVDADPKVKIDLWTIYDRMVTAWLIREQWGDIGEMRIFAELIATNIHMHKANRRRESLEIAELRELKIEAQVSIEEYKLTGRSLLNRNVAGYFKFSHRSIFEFLVISSVFRGDQNAASEPWTDLMKYFFLLRSSYFIKLNGANYYSAHLQSSGVYRHPNAVDRLHEFIRAEASRWPREEYIGKRECLNTLAFLFTFILRQNIDADAKVVVNFIGLSITKNRKKILDLIEGYVSLRDGEMAAPINVFRGFSIQRMMVAAYKNQIHCDSSTGSLFICSEIASLVFMQVLIYKSHLPISDLSEKIFNTYSALGSRISGVQEISADLFREMMSFSTFRRQCYDEINHMQRGANLPIAHSALQNTANLALPTDAKAVRETHPISKLYRGKRAGK